MTNLFDEFQSHRSGEDSINARRHMVERGWWPGGAPPDGFKLVVAPDHPKRKVAALDHDRRPVIERIYDLALYGDGTSAPLGVKAITIWLNEHGVRTRTGALWGCQGVHRILTETGYFGDYYWGKNPAINEYRDERAPLLLKIPPIVSRARFDDVQHQLERRDPKMGAAKLTSSPLLLAGLAHCMECGKAMTLRTGKGGKYRYYYCSGSNSGKRICSGPSIPEKDLNEAVLNSVRTKVLNENHLLDVISGLQRRERTRAQAASHEVPALRARVTAAESAMQGLWASIRIAPSLEADPLFQRSIETAADELGLARTRLEEAVSTIGEKSEIGEAEVVHFREQMINLLEDPKPARTKIYLSTILAQVEVGVAEIL